MPTDYPGAFSALKTILQRYQKDLIVLSDTQADYTVITKATGPNKKPLWFAAVLSKKSAVSFHLLPLYYHPGLNDLVSPELQKRKQGKACFNFQRPDPALFEQLAALTAAAHAQWSKGGILQERSVAAEELAAIGAVASKETKKKARPNSAKKAR